MSADRIPRPGDLCLLIASREAGKLVTAIRRLSHAEARRITGCQPGQQLPRENFWLLDRTTRWEIVKTGEVEHWPVTAERYLLPLRPPPDEVETTTTEELSA